MDRAGRLAALAAASALDDAGAHGVPAERMAAVIGCVHGGAQTLHEGEQTLAARGPARVSPLTIPLGLTNAPVAAVARTLDVRGPTAVTGTACAAGTDAIGAGVQLIRDGRADLVVAGGAEAPLTPLLVAGYRQLGALSTTDRPSPEASRPFDAERDGFVIGEGAGILVLEEREHALARGARIHAEVIGHASTCDAGHLTDPDPAGTGAARAIALALADARLTPADVGYINAHATSTPAGDAPRRGRSPRRAPASAGLGDQGRPRPRPRRGRRRRSRRHRARARTPRCPATLNLVTPTRRVPRTRDGRRRRPRERSRLEFVRLRRPHACLVMRAHHPPV